MAKLTSTLHPPPLFTGGYGMVTLTRNQDAYGRQVYDQYLGKETCESVERDDGFIDTSGGAPAYFAEFRDWPMHQKRAAKFVTGRVLDVGAGAGRWSLHLQSRGHEVVAIDNSPLALKTCRLRGVKDARLVPVTRIGPALGRFDTILMMGNNFGLFGNPRRARWLLRRLKAVTNPGARIVAESNDPHKTTNPVHLRYQRFNWRRGRLAGGLRIRVRYQDSCTPWFDYLIVSRREMEAILDGTGWRVMRYIDSGGSSYVAVIEQVEG
jgi:SAM-dependent methyltransferase